MGPAGVHLLPRAPALGSRHGVDGGVAVADGTAHRADSVGAARILAAAVALAALPTAVVIARAL